MKAAQKQRLEDLFVLSGNYLDSKTPEERGRSAAALAINILTGSKSPLIWDVLYLKGVPSSPSRRPRRIFDAMQLQAHGARTYIAELNPRVPRGVESNKTSNETTTTIFTPIGCVTLGDVPLVFLERHVEYPDVLSCYDPSYEPEDGEELLPVKDIDFVAMDARADDAKIKSSYPAVTSAWLIKLREEGLKQGLF